MVKDNKSLKNISMNFSRTARPVIVMNNKKERKGPVHLRRSGRPAANHCRERADPVP